MQENQPPTQQKLTAPRLIIIGPLGFRKGDSALACVYVASSGVGTITLRRFCCLSGTANGGREGSTTLRGAEVMFYGKEGYRDVVANAVFSSIDKEIKAAVEKVVVEFGITSIASEAFEKCVNLKEVILPDSLVTIRDSAFQSRGVVSIQIPDSVTQIEADVFHDCKNLASVKLPSNLESIGFLAFASCASLTGLELPDSLTTIGSKAFIYTGILELTYPKNLTNLDYGTLDSSKVKNVTVSAGAVMSNNIGECLELTDITFLGDHSVDEVSAVLGELARGAERSKTTMTVHADSGSVAEGWTNKNIADQGWQYVKFAAN